MWALRYGRPESFELPEASAIFIELVSHDVLLEKATSDHADETLYEGSMVRL